ncbi:MAG: SET domain-containing protein-lysine N-methyltransferase [Saprospiraceae bacterium]|jgi:hypothetical protein|nr:SET domain-containing protein-lysine N-methyltransferase [Saprospiraceae bacterium]MBK6480721.1 SET domain-containing protein-lysine N-methyltransferase [Saprospiraceae bacterium]MBK6816919.1 SET domain-containing protein-lysine N-methyltransferase [Saprospiraceae bacterium]MBK7371448.1 SET domain-containing protein-lysine N-methyltransferase [Saprospiraceae bacterium]MBK7436057.1 SET domain-containing protein-lysine N-methyltransferase [Saprospiraceae bacterium]
MKILPQVYIAQTPQKGRGVFTALEIPAGSLIEICPIILIPASQTLLIDQTEIYNYYFVWDEHHLAVALGFGSLYNHQDPPNARVIFDYESEEIQIEAIRDINEEEEITINYIDDDERKASLWFDVK